MMAVWNMQGASHDIWAVNTDFEYHEEQKLEPPARRAARQVPEPCASASTRRAGPTAAATAASPASCCGPWPRSAPSHEFVCFLDERAAARFDLDAPQRPTPWSCTQGASPTTAAAADGYRSPFDMLRLTRAVAREPLDVFFSPSVYTYFPLPPGLPAVVTVHDAIAERFPELTLPNARARLFWRAEGRARAVAGAAGAHGLRLRRDEIAEVLGIARARIRVALEAPSPDYAPSESPETIAALARRIGSAAGRALADVRRRLQPAQERGRHGPRASHGVVAAPTTRCSSCWSAR